MRDIYNDQTYLSDNTDWHAKDAPFKAEKILQFLKKIPNLQNVADVGCGSGEILIELSKNLPGDIKLFGFDISKDAVNIAKQKENDRIKIEQKDFANEPVNIVFDVLLVIDVIEHIHNYFAFLEGLKNKSRYIIFHIPVDMCMWSLFREKILIESKERVGHIHVYTEDFIKSVIEEYGFKIVAEMYTEPTFEQMTSKQKLINTIRKIFFRINKRFCSKTLGGYSLLLLTENISPRRNL